MDRILISLKKEKGPRASSVPALGLNTVIFKHVYWYWQQTQVSVYRTIGPLVSYFSAWRVWYIITPPMGEIEKFCFRPSPSFSIAMTARLKRKKSLTNFFSFFLLGGFGTP